MRTPSRGGRSPPDSSVRRGSSSASPTCPTSTRTSSETLDPDTVADPNLVTVKVDLKKELPAYRARRGRFELREVPVAQYLMIDGAGDPNTSSAYAEAIAALLPVAYSLKFASRKLLDIDTVVMPLEGL